jgi:hypothetical protein
MFNNTAIAKAEAKLKARRRNYPKFHEGMSPAEYVQYYYALNSMRWVPTAFGIQRGAYTAGLQYEQLHKQVVAFFQPLPTLPMFTPSAEVLEETI